MDKTNTGIAAALLSGQGKLLFLLLLVGCIESGRNDGPSNRFNRQVFAKSLILEGEAGAKGRSAQQFAVGQAKSPEFLFLASTLGAPRKLASQRSNLQGQEKNCTISPGKECIESLSGG